MTESCWQPSIHHSEADTNTRVKQLRPSRGGDAINHEQTYETHLLHYVLVNIDVDLQGSLWKRSRVQENGIKTPG